jgi:two-component system, LytTR family, response regulator
MNCIIVDNQPLAREGMRAMLQKYNDVNIIAVCKNGEELQEAMASMSPDIIFLDNNTSNKSSLEFLRERQDKISVVITTAYHQPSLDTYPINVLDYLAMPNSTERIDKTLQKLRDFIAFKNFTEKQSNYIYFDDILYIEALRNYVYFYLPQRRLLHYASLSSVLNRLPANLFKRIHKSYIINLQKVDQFRHGFVTIKQAELPYSKCMRDDLKLALFGSV